MSSSFDATSRGFFTKAPPDHLEKEIIPSPTQAQFDGVDDEWVNQSYHGQFTRNDQRDMGRMGKIQELKASATTLLLRLRFG